VLVLNEFSNWSWHSPQLAASREGPSFIDTALPPEFRCQTRPGAWLYRCEVPSGGPDSGGACWQRPRHWPHIDPQSFLTGIEGLLFYEIEVRPNGSLTFNSDEVDVAGLQELLATTEQLTPPPPLVLRTTASSDCKTAEQVRAMLDARPLCRMGNCFESSRWSELGLPTFKAHVNRFAHVEGVRR
jgi:hypothetical protein